MNNRRATLAVLTVAVSLTGMAGMTTDADARASLTDIVTAVNGLFTQFQELIGLAPEEQRRKLAVMEKDFNAGAEAAGWRKVETTATRPAVPADSPGTTEPTLCPDAACAEEAPRTADRMCPDGSVISNARGRCLRTAAGTCKWTLPECPESSTSTASPLASCDSLNFAGEFQTGTFADVFQSTHDAGSAPPQYTVKGRFTSPFNGPPFLAGFGSVPFYNQARSGPIETAGRATGEMQLGLGTIRRQDYGQDYGKGKIIVNSGEKTFATARANGDTWILETRATFGFYFSDNGKKGEGTILRRDDLVRRHSTFVLTLRGNVPNDCPLGITPLEPVRPATSVSDTPVPPVSPDGVPKEETPTITTLPPLPAKAPTAPWAERPLVQCKIWYCMAQWWQGGGAYASDMVTALDQTSKIRMSNGADSAQYIRGGPYTTLAKAQDSANKQCSIPADPVDPACATTWRSSPPGAPTDEPIADAQPPHACTETGQQRVIQPNVFLSDDGTIVAYSAQGYGTDVHSYPPITYYVDLAKNTVRRLDRRSVLGMSPDGGKLLLSEGMGNAPRASLYDVATGTAEGIPGIGAAMSPDGRYVLYGTKKGNTLTSPTCVNLYDLQTRESREIRCGMSANFRGDSSIVLVYANATNGGRTISSDNIHHYLYDLHTGTMTPISAEESVAFGPMQSSDGKRSLVIKGSNFGRGPFTKPDLQRLYLKERTPTAQEIRVLFEMFTQKGADGKTVTYRPAFAQISADGTRVVAVIEEGIDSFSFADRGYTNTTLRRQILLLDIGAGTWNVVNPQGGNTCTFPLPGSPQRYVPPDEGHFVIDGSVTLFSDAQCQERRGDVHGIMLTEKKSNGTESRSIVPTSKPKDAYLPGMQVFPLWNTSRAWNASWYQHLSTRRCEYAWDSSADFVGAELP